MAETDLRIVIRVVDEKKAAENLRQLKESFGSITDIQHAARFESLGRQFKLTDPQIKQLAEVVNKPTGALAGFAAGFGKAGAIMLALNAAIEAGKLVVNAFTSAAKSQLDYYNAAVRMGGTHGAQIKANIQLMEKMGQIDPGRGMVMLENFQQKWTEFQRHNSQFRDELMEAAGESGDIMRQHFRELAEAPDQETRMNLVRRYSEQIEKFWTERGQPEKGAEEKKKYLRMWFGLDDMTQMTVDFVKVSKEAEAAFERNTAAAREFWEVSTDLKNNLDDLIGALLTSAVESLGVGEWLQGINRRLQSALEEKRKIDLMTPEQFKQYIEEKQRQERRTRAEQERKQRWPERYSQPEQPTEPQSQQMRLLGNYTDKQGDLLSEQRRLVENLQTLNAHLSALAEKPVPGERSTREDGTFHNQPMGGAAGESNPMQLPADAAQPGGGSAAEARRSLNSTLDLAGQRERYRLEMGRNPKVREQLLRTTTTEFPEDPHAIMEETLNRAAARNMTLQQALSDKRYFPGVSLKGEDPGQRRERFDRALDDVLGGSNVTGYATGNYQATKKWPESELGETPKGLGGTPGTGGIGGLVTYLGRTRGIGAETLEQGMGFPTNVKELRRQLKLPTEYLGIENQPADVAWAQQRLEAQKIAASGQPGPGFRGGREVGKEQQLVQSQLAEAEFYADQPAAPDPRKMQRAVERIQPGSEEEWELRKSQALGDTRYTNIYSEFENVPGRSQREGGRLPEPFEFRGKGGSSIQREMDKRLKEYDEYYDRPKWYERGQGYEKERFDPRSGERLPGQGTPISERRLLDRDMGADLDVKGKLNVEVTAPRGADVKAEGDGMFENNVTLDRRMDDGGGGGNELNI